MHHGAIKTDVETRTDDDSFYYRYSIETTWKKERTGRMEPYGAPEWRYTWSTDVLRIDQDGVRYSERGNTVFDFPRYAPLDGEATGTGGHRQALDAHKQVVFMVMG